MIALLTQDRAAIEKAAASFFDVKFRSEDLTLATKLIQHVPPESNGTAHEFAKLMQKKLQELGINYEVKIVAMHGFQCRPNHAR